MAEIADYDPSSALNNAAPPTGAPEGMTRSDVNNVIREHMGAHRRDWDGSGADGGAWRNPVKGETVQFLSASSVLILATDARAYFPVGRKVKVSHSGSADAWAFVETVAFATNTTVTMERFDDSGVVAADVNKLEFFNAFGGTAEHGLGRGAFMGEGGGKFIIPPTMDDIGINAAIVEAVAAGDGMVLLQRGIYTLENPVVINDEGVTLLGQGNSRLGGTKLKVNNARNINAIELDGLASGYHISNFYIDGKGTGQTTAGHGIRIDGTSDFGIIRDISMEGTWDAGIYIGGGSTSAQGLLIENITIDRPGGHGIDIRQPGVGTSAVDIVLRNINVSTPGFDYRTLLTACGVRVQGTALLSDITVHMDQQAGHTGAGIYLDIVDAAATPSKGGDKCTLSNFYIDGTGVDVVGLRIGGNRSRAANGVVALTGAPGSNQPLRLDGRSGSDPAVDNCVSSCTFKGGLRCEVIGDAHRSEITDCHFEGQSAAMLRTAGPDTLVRNCSFVGGIAGLTASAGATDLHVQGCNFRDQSSNGMEISDSGASIQSSSFRGMANGVSVQTGGDECSITSCEFADCTGDGVASDAAETAVVGCTFHDNDDHVAFLSAACVDPTVAYNAMFDHVTNSINNLGATGTVTTTPNVVK